MTDFMVFDDFVPSPEAYRDLALKTEFRSFEFPECTFHGISTPTPEIVPAKLCAMFPGITPMLSFFRKSPLGQVEPHWIHSDIDMGQWSAVLYLNQNPPEGDGTAFWTHKASGAIGSLVPHERSAEGNSIEGWTRRAVVQAKFNRMVVFPSHLFHSRAIHENWGEGNESRLTQVTFGQGDIA